MRFALRYRNYVQDSLNAAISGVYSVKSVMVAHPLSPVIGVVKILLNSLSLTTIISNNYDCRSINNTQTSC